MKRFFWLLLVGVLGFSQAGCYGWLSGQQNTIVTTTYPDGRLVVEQSLTDDGMYYRAVQEIKVARYEAARCDICDPGERIGLLAVAGLADDEVLVKGMNGFELADRAMKSVGPYALGAYAVERLTSRPDTVNMNGDNATYAPFETHVTNSDSATVDIPYRFGTTEMPTTTTTTSAPVMYP